MYIRPVIILNKKKKKVKYKKSNNMIVDLENYVMPKSISYIFYVQNPILNIMLMFTLMCKKKWLIDNLQYKKYPV